MLKTAFFIVLGLGLTAYVGSAILLTALQSKFIYPAPTVDAPVPVGVEQVAYRTSDNIELKAGYVPAAAGKPTVLYFHGNGSDWVSSVAACERLIGQGYGLLAAEYRGYRGNAGSPSEDGLYADGRAALAFLAERDVAPSDIIIIGNSIGSGTATQMASEANVAGLVLISPFASLTRLVGEKVSWLPVSLLLRDHYDNIGKIGRLDAPVLIMHGTADTLIPIAHAEALGVANPSAELAVFADIGHDLAWHPSVQPRIAQFIETLFPKTR